MQCTGRGLSEVLGLLDDCSLEVIMDHLNQIDRTGIIPHKWLLFTFVPKYQISDETPSVTSIAS